MNKQDTRKYLVNEFDRHGIGECEYLPIIDFIINDGYDMTGWVICEIPVEDRYCFFNEVKDQCFDLWVENGVITAQYMDSPDIHHINHMYNATFIGEAVAKYNWPEAGIVPAA